MGRIISKETVSMLLNKYKYVFLIFLIGIVLMLIPPIKEAPSDNKDISEEKTAILSVEERLGIILSQVKGAGNVKIMLSLASGEETLYQTNDDLSTGNDSDHSQTDTVTVTDAQRNETGLIRQVNPPTYLGAVVVCQGADHPAVRLAIIEAVSKATGLGTDKISVLKMK